MIVLAARAIVAVAAAIAVFRRRGV